MVTDKYIQELFKNTNFGEAINGSVELQRQFLAKKLKHQIDGYWTGHTAYHILKDGGFLIDGKSGAKKKLTKLGFEFLEENKIMGE